VNENQQKGKDAEEATILFLRRKGYVIRDVNWRYSYYEIDIVAQDGDVLVIGEVKFRNDNTFGEPEEAVKRPKRSRLLAATEAYIDFKKWTGEVRFDIFSVVLVDHQYKVYHIEDAFYPGL
jgi:putative endonuclease